MACALSSSSVPSTGSFLFSEFFSTRSTCPNKLSSVSWISSTPLLNVPICSLRYPPLPTTKQDLFVQAAYTRRSRSEAAKKPSRKSWKQRTDMYMRPFLLNVFISKKFVHAKVVHRGTSKVISVATTNSKDLRTSLPSLIDHNACRIIGKLIAERSKEADIYAIAYEPRKDERIEGKLGIVIDTIKENGIIFVCA